MFFLSLYLLSGVILGIFMHVMSGMKSAMTSDIVQSVHVLEQSVNGFEQGVISVVALLIHCLYPCVYHHEAGDHQNLLMLYME